MVKHKKNLHGFAFRLIIALIILIVSIFSSIFTINYVNKLPKQEITFDQIHNLIPYNPLYAIIGEFLIILVALLFIWNIFRYKTYERIPFYIASIGLFYIIKSIVLPLTPIASPYTATNTYGILYNIIPPGGTFPSGHAGFVFLLYLIVYRELKNNKKNDIDTVLKSTILILNLIIAILMITSRGHYTIDIIGGLMIAYITYKIMYNRDVKNYFI